MLWGTSFIFFLENRCYSGNQKLSLKPSVAHYHIEHQHIEYFKATNTFDTSLIHSGLSTLQAMHVIHLCFWLMARACNRIVLRESNFKSAHPNLLKGNIECASKTIGKPNAAIKQDIYLTVAAVALPSKEEKSFYLAPFGAYPGSISCIEWHLQIMLILCLIDE